MSSPPLPGMGCGSVHSWDLMCKFVLHGANILGAVVGGPVPVYGCVQCAALAGALAGQRHIVVPDTARVFWGGPGVAE